MTKPIMENLWAEEERTMSATLHAFRRCHICGCVGNSPKNIDKCTGCGKPFAPFYYFNDQFTPVANEGEMRPPEIGGQWRPIHGLTAYWQID